MMICLADVNADVNRRLQDVRFLSGLQSILPSINNPTVCLKYLKQPKIMAQHN